MLTHKLYGRICPDEIEHRIEYLVGMTLFVGHARNSQNRPLPQVLTVDFRNGDIEFSLNPLLQTEENLALALE